ncbi:PAS domain-containing hybrid sensor histidine kinase/response regulator [Filimonas effusa]|uniref:histidine kinase n=1 Tax=Filimonas effusa TaxID=2508721 RepID=A0A4Q1D628_9BACT|nr:ATP-binding protein [Filimonas effusa]RXK83868.1 response regulator [Filimonas effusa]
MRSITRFVSRLLGIERKAAAATAHGLAQVFDFLAKEISVPRQNEQLIAVARRAGEKHAAALLPDYFLLERYLTNLDPEQKYTQQSLREVLRQRFEWLTKDPYFSVLFLHDPGKKQQQAVYFIRRCLAKATDNFGFSGGGLFEQMGKELELLELEIASEAVLKKMEVLSIQIYHYIVANFGEAIGDRIFNQSYEETARIYKELEVFHSLISILPQKLVGFAQLNQLTHVQVRQALIEKVSEIKDLNNQLSQKMLETEMARSQAGQTGAMLENVVASSLDAIISMNEMGIITAWNMAAETIFGYTQREAIGQSMAGLIIPIRYREQHERGLRHFLETHRSHILNQRLEMEAQRSNGVIFPVELTITAIEHKGRYSFNGFLRDISDRKQREHELQQTKEQAEKAAQAKTEFLSVMSHEIRTPLSAIIGFTHLLLSKSPRPDQKHFLDPIKKSGEDLLAIVNNILDINKLEAGALELEKENFNLKELLQDLCETFLPATTSGHKQIALFLEYDVRLPLEVSGDQARLSQLLRNLVSNAIKFTEKGWVKLIVTLVRETAQYAEIAFAVKDTGIGIAEDKRELVFNVFTQAQSDTTRKYGGTGLGLFISRRIVQLMGGDIKLETMLHQGSTFSFVLQMRHATASGSTMPADEHYDKGQDFTGRHILMAEDNSFNVMVAQEFIESWGGEITIAANGQEAIELCMHHEYDLILMDLQMPVMDGFASTREIRKFNLQIPIIALTASPIDEVVGQVWGSGMNDYVSKPFVPEQLYNKLKQYLPDRSQTK